MSRKKQAQSKAAKILIVNDEPDVCALLSRWLTSEGFSCETADNGPMAVMLLAENKFDLVISDMIVPGMSGIDLLTIVRDPFPDTAVLILAAAGHRKKAVSALDLGAYGYVIKPFDKNEILISTGIALERLRLK